MTNRNRYSGGAEETVNGAPAREYTYGLQRIDEDQIVNNAWTPSYYGYDGMGSVRQLTSAAGTVTDTYEYDAFGNKIASSGTTPNKYMYRGEQYDSDLGLYYLRARYYNPATGRFISRDPQDGDAANPATLHKYVYADGDPVDQLDPSGQSALAEEEEIEVKIDSRAPQELTPIAASVSCIFLQAASSIGELTYGLTIHQLIVPIVVPGSCFAIPLPPIPIGGGGPKRSPSSQPGPQPAPGPFPQPAPDPRQRPDRCAKENPGLPVNVVHASRTPNIAAHIAFAQAAGYPNVLTYLGRLNPQQKVNRAAACPQGKYNIPGMECDEYPYASTAEGGAGSSTAPAPSIEQRIQGGELGSFYGSLTAGQQFCVEVIP